MATNGSYQKPAKAKLNTNLDILCDPLIAHRQGEELKFGSSAKFVNRKIYRDAVEGRPEAIREFMRHIDANDQAISDEDESRNHQRPGYQPAEPPQLPKPPKLRRVAEALIILNIMGFDLEDVSALGPVHEAEDDEPGVALQFYISDWALELACNLPGGEPIQERDLKPVRCPANCRDALDSKALNRRCLEEFRRLYPNQGKLFQPGSSANPKGRKRKAHPDYKVPYPYLQVKRRVFDGRRMRQLTVGQRVLLGLCKKALHDDEIRKVMAPYFHRATMARWNANAEPETFPIIRLRDRF